MGQMKKIAELVHKYNKLRGREKEAVQESMEELKKAVGYKEGNNDDCMITYAKEKKDVNTHKNGR